MLKCKSDFTLQVVYVTRELAQPLLYYKAAILASAYIAFETIVYGEQACDIPP
jgi:hypothetical protein